MISAKEELFGEISKKGVDFAGSLMLYYEIAVFGLVCPKTAVTQGFSKG